MIVFFGDDLGFAERLSHARIPVDRIEVRFNPDWSQRPIIEVAQLLTDGAPACVVIGPSTGAIDPLAVIAAIDSIAPGTSVVLSHPLNGNVVLAAMRAGARDVLAPNCSDADLYSGIVRAVETSTRRRHVQLAEAVEAERVSTTVSIVSPRGGVGRTMVASNLAVALARRHPGDVALVDLDVQFGDVTASLGLTSGRSLADAASAVADGIDPAQLKAFLSHHPSDLYVLGGTESLVEAEDIDPVHAKEILVGLQESFSYVVIDTSAAVTDFSLTALEASTDAALVSTTDVAGVRGLRRMLDALDAIGMVDQKRHLIVNRSTDRYGITVQHVEDAAGMPALVEIPGAREIAVATNQGVPVVDMAGRNPVLKAIKPLLDELDHDADEGEARSLRFWKRSDA